MDVYICHTIYHLLIVLLKINMDDRCILMLSSDMKYVEKYVLFLKKHLKHSKVILLDEKYFIRKRMKYTQNTIQMYNELFKNVNRIYIFNSHTQIGFFFHRKKIPYHVIEDGYNVLKDPLGTTRNTIKNKIKYFLFQMPKYHGFSKYCLTIEVNDLNGLPVDERYKKFIEVPRKELFDNLQNNKRNLILQLFDVQEMVINEKAVLILTQPLFTDYLVESKEMQLNIYKNIIQEYIEQGYTIYLKIHPRDTIDYSFFDVEIIKDSMPVELLDFVLKGRFEYGITVTSTALDFLNCIDNKIYLKELIQ